MAHEIVEKEMAHGGIAGSDYGSAVRIIMRSPTHVMFAALGIQLWDRKEHGGWHSLKCLSRKQAGKETFKALAPQINAVFGDGAAEVLSSANLRSNTVLIDGGGAPMPLPRSEWRKAIQDQHRAVTPDWSADLSGEIACCKQCSKPLRLDTDHHRIGFTIQPNHPKSHEDCQRMTNQRVVAVHGFDNRYKDRWEYVSWFETWDGESYIDDMFCSDKCAGAYGRRAARDLPPLEAGVEPPRREHRVRSDVEYNPKPDQTITLNDGRTIRI